MKKIITLGVFFAVFAWMQATAQTATSNCSQVIVTNIGIVPPKPHGYPVIVVINPFITNDCSVIVNSYGVANSIRYILQKKDNNGNFYNVTSSTLYETPPTYSNLERGTYRVHIHHSSEFDGECVHQSTGELISPPNVYLYNGIFLGKLGEYRSGVGEYFTNEVVVGAPTQNDNQWAFLNGNNNLILNTMFDPGEPIRIDATACKNFDKYDVAIQEFWPGGTPGRWRSKSGNYGINGLISNAQIPLGVENLRAIFDPIAADPNWQFIPGNTYRVQVAISNSACSSWIDNLQTFFLCYSTWGCRGGIDQAKIEPSISPNPVSRTFKIDGIEFNPVSSVKDELIIHDLTGRRIKNFKTIQNNEFDVSDLATGVYMVSVLRDDHKLFTKKLVVSH